MTREGEGPDQVGLLLSLNTGSFAHWPLSPGLRLAREGLISEDKKLWELGAWGGSSNQSKVKAVRPVQGRVGIC